MYMAQTVHVIFQAIVLQGRDSVPARRPTAEGSSLIDKVVFCSKVG